MCRRERPGRWCAGRGEGPGRLWTIRTVRCLHTCCEGAPGVGSAPSMTWGCVWAPTPVSGSVGAPWGAGGAGLPSGAHSGARAPTSKFRQRKEQRKEGRKPFGCLWRGATGEASAGKGLPGPSHPSCPGWAWGHMGSLWPGPPRPQMGVWQGERIDTGPAAAALGRLLPAQGRG